MKRHWLKKIFCAGMALMLAAGLCACGDGGTEKGKENTGRESGGSVSVDSGAPGGKDTDSAGDTGNANVKTNANAGLAKENVYRVSEVELPESASSVMSAAHCDGTIYAVLQVYDFENGHKYFVLSMDESGNVLRTAFLELPGETGGEEAEEPDPNMWEMENTRYSDFVFGSDGRLYALRQYQYSYMNYLTDQSIDEQHQYVCCWNADGSFLWQAEPLEDSAEDVSVRTILPEADGSLELLLTGEKAYRSSVREDGSPAETDAERLSEETCKALGNCRRLLRKKDGSCLLLCRDGESLSLMEYDPRTDTLGERFGLPDTLNAVSLGSVVFSAGMDSDLIYADRTGVYAYSMGDEQSRLKMNYVNSDRNITDTGFLLELDETRFVMFYREDYARELKAGIFEYVKPEDIPDRAVIILAGLTINGGIKNRVVQYNRNSDKYRIVLKEYETSEDLNLDIVSGRMPDILLAEGLPNGDSIPMDSYIAKGLIADVGALIEEDGELSREDYLENVFEAYSVDGKLRYVIPSFTLFTMAAKSSLVGDGSDWSVEKMMEVLNGMGGEACLMDGLSRSIFMEKLLEYRGNDFIDLKTGKCTFDSPEFIEMMKYAYTLPEERSWAWQTGEGEYELQYLKNRTLLKELHIWTFIQNVDERLFYQLNGYLGGEYTLVGFPAGYTEQAARGRGAFVRGENLMALSAVSDNQEGAWDFARYYLTDEYQRSLESSLPVCRRIFEEWAEEETRRSHYTDENGKQVEYDLTLYRGEEAVVVPPFSREQLDQLIAYVESVTATSFEDKNVMNIIYEEMGSYFSGQKTAEDAAALIQNRVQIYVQENQ